MENSFWNMWQTFYQWNDPVALSIFGLFDIRWYGLMYVLALGTGYLVGRNLVKNGQFKMTLEQYDKAFIWVEIGVILGARLGYVLFYDPNVTYMLTHPWQIFNPFSNGQFVGISGLSYHGAIIGFVIGAYFFCKSEGIKLLAFLDFTTIAGSAGYGFGRLGNFMNERLVGRQTDVDWGIYVSGVLRHPSALYEAFLEGLVIFIILFWFRMKKTFDGQMLTLYAMLYATARFIVEFYRQPDEQLGFLLLDWLTMGQILSFVMFALALAAYLFFQKTQSLTPFNKA
jgi:phosphatidylglycerol:prolipoprotein diacylglycerol transferase